MLVYLLDVNKEQLDDIDLPKEDVLGLTIYDEIVINFKMYGIIKKKIYYEEDDHETYMNYAEFIVAELN